MKFFRMDSDVLDWDRWELLAEEILPKDFQSAVTVWLAFYAECCKELRDADQKTIQVSVRKVANAARVQRRKAVRLLEIMGPIFGFTLEAVEPKRFANGSQTVRKRFANGSQTGNEWERVGKSFYRFLSQVTGKTETTGTGRWREVQKR